MDDYELGHLFLRRLSTLGLLLFVPAAFIFAVSLISKGFFARLTPQNLGIANAAPYVYVTVVAVVFLIGWYTRPISIMENRAGEKKSTKIRVRSYFKLIGAALFAGPLYGWLQGWPWLLPTMLIGGFSLSVVGWVPNRVFGFTRGWARNRCYLRRVEALQEAIRLNTVGIDDAGKLWLLMQNEYHTEVCNAIVSDNFHYSDKLTDLLSKGK